MNDKRRKYAAEASVRRELLDRYPTYAPRIEEELVYRLTDPIVKEAIKGECIVRFSETEQRQYFTTDLIESRKYVYIEEIVRCKDCIDCYQNQIFRNWYCERFGVEVQLDFYCAGAKRRSDV